MYSIKFNLNNVCSRGFTLIELLVVISVIVIIAGFVTTAVYNGRTEARDMSRQTDLQQIKLGLKLYKEAHGEYPDYPEGTEIGVGLSIDDELRPFLGEIKGDPLSSSGGGGEYGYWYSSAYACAGETRVVVMARSVEKDKFANYEKVCGAGDSSARDVPWLAQYVIPTVRAGDFDWDLNPDTEDEEDAEDGGEVQEEEDEDVPGCMDPEAINYIAEATYDDGSCIYTEGEEQTEPALDERMDLIYIVS